MVSRWLDSWRRNRLFRKYLVPFVGVVLLSLLGNGLLEIYFSFQENKVALAQNLREKALSAGLRIEGFVKEIERQMGWTTQPQLAVSGGLEQRRLDFVRLLRQVLPITEVAYIDAQGREQLRVSRLAMDVIGPGADRATDPRFTETRGGRVWYGAVYFRKETEPYMTIAIPHGVNAPVTAAEVNLKFIWDVVSQIRIGKFGQAYVVDAAGHLIAHPDISLVLKKTDLSDLPHIRAARAAVATAEGWDEGMLGTSLDGRRALVAYTAIAPLGWLVVVEQPVIEAFAPLRGSIVRTALLMLVGVLVSVAASFVLARRMTRPIQALHAGAARIGAGDLAHELDVKTRDELDDLAGEFNRMTTRLRESYATLEQRVEERTRELRETLDQQTATSEILGVISSSPTDVEPVMQALVRAAATLCEAQNAQLFRVEHGVMRLVARFGPVRSTLEVGETRAITRASVSGRTILDRATLHVTDVLAVVDREYADIAGAIHREGIRTTIGVPLLREGTPIGAITAFRTEVRPFTDKQIALLQTFADQAVIAIENVRLFTELEAKNSALGEALEQQTATAEILSAISSSPTDVRPVFDAIVQSAVRLLGGHSASVLRVIDEQLHLAALTSTNDEADAALRASFPAARGAAAVAWHVVDSKEPYVVTDVDSDPHIRASASLRGYRSMLCMPMVREGRTIGVIAVTRREPGGFSGDEIALLQTFADQAVIAIENVRLFEELESRNAALTDALDRQTATSEVLRVISESPSDVGPVLAAVAERAARLCGADNAQLWERTGDRLRLASTYGTLPTVYAIGDTTPLTADRISGRAVLERRLVHVHDLDATPDSEYRLSKQAASAGTPYRTALAMPLLREGRALGAIFIRRVDVRPFDGAQIALLETFADQAAIAIENVRLFKELEARNAALAESLDQQTATSEILRVISGSLADVQPVFDAIARSATRLSGAMFTAVLHYDGARFQLVARDNIPAEVEGLFPIAPRGLNRIMLETRQTVHSEDIPNDPRSQYPRLAAEMGYRSGVFVPMLREGEVIGCIFVGRGRVHPFTDKQIALLETFADQAVIAVENARLFDEIQEKTRQLEAANRHKDEFLASMSHELRTPLNAVIGFSEVLLERMFGELNDKQEEYLNDILASGRHLLSLINDILDLAKIEAGRMELDLEEFELAQAIDNAVVLVRERATRKGLVLETALGPELGSVRGDQRKVKQVLLNLLSNAVKFTPEGGRVAVHAQRLDGSVEVSVSDTGIGIAAEDQDVVFEEFRQVGTDYAKKHEGTGLGLTLSRKFVELHGGHITVKSRLGEGSTFTFTLPVQPWRAS